MCLHNVLSCHHGDYHRAAEQHICLHKVCPVNFAASLGFQGALQKENYRLLSVFENFAAKRLDISFLFRQAVLEILFER